MGGPVDQVHDVLSQSLDDVYKAIKQLRDAAIPGNAKTVEEAGYWYRMLGIYNSGSVALDDMNAAIVQKYNYPGDEIYRQHVAFIEAKLRLAGFDVRVNENLFQNNSGDTVSLPTMNMAIKPTMASSYTYCGSSMCGGGGYQQKAVRYLEQEKDITFDAGPYYRCTIFISGDWYRGARVSPRTMCGSTYCGHDHLTVATVPAVRKVEFRQLVIQLKQATHVAYLFVQYS
jgi:hypothetical protein